MAIMDGKYILKDDMDTVGRGDLQILREWANNIYETVVPDAGKNREFAMGLVDILNSQGSQAGQTSG